MRPSAVLAVLPLAAAAGPPQARRGQPAPLLVPQGAGAQAVADKYIVKFHEGRAVAAVDGLLRNISREVEHVYQGIFSGFAATLDGEALAAVRDNPDVRGAPEPRRLGAGADAAQVEFVEQDAVKASGVTTQRGAPWDLGRISHRQPGSPTYVFDAGAGAGTCAYVVDTGIDDSHPGFGGRAQQVWSAYSVLPRDGHGHGTYVAGIIGSGTYGVAKRMQLLGVKVLDDWEYGDNAAIIAGMQFVADAALYSPASEPAVCTVGGTAPDDTRYPSSNWGPAVNILAPAVDVLSLWPGGESLAARAPPWRRRTSSGSPPISAPSRASRAPTPCAAASRPSPPRTSSRTSRAAPSTCWPLTTPRNRKSVKRPCKGR